MVSELLIFCSVSQSHHYMCLFVRRQIRIHSFIRKSYFLVYANPLSRYQDERVPALKSLTALPQSRSRELLNPFGNIVIIEFDQCSNILIIKLDFTVGASLSLGSILIPMSALEVSYPV